jgi:CRISPR system Cascade subunit CasA
MNLLTEPWMPVRKHDGSRDWIAPNRLSDPAVVAFDADRADFNGALAQFAIGLLQTTTPVDSPIEWRRLFNEPPDTATLGDWFIPVMSAFEIDGDNVRFMQDDALREGGKVQEVASLLIETPGDNGLNKNTDHFVKRGLVDGMCKCCAALALYTLQINAPEGGGGGGGKFTGIRGGGPLTTLVGTQPIQTLWKDTWLNVKERSEFLNLPGDSSKTDLHFAFPWLAPMSLPLGESKVLTPVQVHPAQIFWAMPRRVRLNFNNIEAGVCSICGEKTSCLIHEYFDSTGGLNYEEKGLWDHPLSPYREHDAAGWQPVKPRGPIGYIHWLSWLATTSANRQRRAKIVEWSLDPSRLRLLGGQHRVWAFGYDMASATPVCWYESTLPLYGLEGCGPDAQKNIESVVENWIAAANLAASYLGDAVKDAWFSKLETKKWNIRKAKVFSKKNTAQFWSCTEQQFYIQLRRSIESTRDGSELEDSLRVRENWLGHVSRAALKLFDEDVVGTGQIERQNPKRAAAAFQQLKRNLYGSKMRQALGLPKVEKASAVIRNTSQR